MQDRHRTSLAEIEARRRAWVIGELMRDDPDLSRDAAEALYDEAGREAMPQTYIIGDNTMASVFKAAGLTNLHDLQAAFDAMERALTPTPCSQAITDIVAERRRQIEDEGFDASHDDMATRGQLATAAECYAFQAGARGRRYPDDPEPIGIWPWEKDWWKPADHRRNLIKAGALIVAEVERLDRATGGQSNG